MVRVYLEDEDYRRLLRLRTGLRQYLHWSEQQALAAGLTPSQHQLLLAIRGHDHPRGPTISDVAGYLMLKHHSAVELVQRAGAAGLVERTSDPGDARVVRLVLTGKGAAALERLASMHLEELTRMAGDLAPLWQEYVRAGGREGSNGEGAYPVQVRRIHDAPGEGEGARVLVDRLWPRGIRKDAAAFDHWNADVAPSTQLRRWYGHRPERFAEFAGRYRDELRGEATAGLDQLCGLARWGPVTLLTATRDLPLSAATVLAEEVRQRLSRPGAQPASRHDAGAAPGAPDV